MAVGEDRISQLPDHLICHILSHLSTKKSVRTSLFSTRWRNLWKWVPVLDLDSRTFSDLDVFVSFADWVFHMQRESRMPQLCLAIKNPHGKASLLPWVDAATSRSIQRLDIGILGTFKFDEIPLSVYTCQTLVHLELHQLVLVDAEFFSLPCLKVMQLFYVRYHNEVTLEKLISGSPVLEDLWIMTSSSQKEKVLQVRSQTLERIAIDHQHTLVEIDAPRLQRLRTRLHLTKNNKIIGSSFPANVDIHFGGMRNALDSDNLVVRDILTEISEVRDLAISSFNWKYIFPYSGPLIQFYYLWRLRAIFSASDLQVLPNLLESCPNLENLILELYEEPKTMFLTVPPCLVSSLKCVELISYVSEYSPGELNLLRYFLKNSTILEKLTLRFNRVKSGHDTLKEQVVAMPRCSSTCQVLVL